MTVRARVLLAAGAVVFPLLLAPLLVQPVYAIALVALAAIATLASKSVVYPVALAGLPAVAIGLSGGHNPFPPGTIAEFGAAWIVLALVIAVLRDEDELPLRVLLTMPVVVTVLLALWMLVRLGPSLDAAYGSRKLQLFIAGNVISLIAGVAVGRRRSRFELYVFLSILMAILSSLALARGLLAGQTANVGGRFSITASDSPIGLGRDAAQGIVIAVFLLLASRTGWLRMLAFGALPLVAVALVASGSRGPVVGLAVGLGLLLVLNVGDAAARRRVGLVIAGIVGAVLLVPQLVPGQDIGRAFSIFSGRSQGLSSNGRTQLWDQAWQLFTSHPLWGIGTGSFGRYQPVELFPHNVFLETGAELGIVGLLLVIAFVLTSIGLLFRAWRSAEGADRAQASLVLALFVAALVNACLSSDITSNEALWLIGGLGVGLARRLDLAVPRIDTALLARRRRKSDTAATGEPEQPPRRQRETPAGRVLEPVAGAAVGGVVRVLVETARSGRPVEQVVLQWSDDGETWRDVAVRDERTYELELDEGAVIVRSRRVAEAIAGALGGQPQPSRRRPWAGRSTVELTWHPDAEGPGSVRALTVDAAGVRTASPPVPLVVTHATAAEPEAAAPVPAAEPVRPLVLRVPAGPVRDAVPLGVDGVESFQLEAAGPSGLWRPVAVIGGAIDTRALPDGTVRLRALAGERRSEPVELHVDNDPPAVRITAPRAGDVLAGVVGIEVDAHDAGSSVHSVLAQRSRDGGPWRPIIGASWDTTTDEDGTWLLRAIAVDEARHVGTSEVVAVQVENAVPAEPEPVEPEPVEPEPVEPEPVEIVEPVLSMPPRAPVPSGQQPDLFTLSDALRAAELDPYRREELEAILYHLRDHADVDGTLPPQFAALIEEEFGSVLPR